MSDLVTCKKCGKFYDFRDHVCPHCEDREELMKDIDKLWTLATLDTDVILNERNRYRLSRILSALDGHLDR